MALEKVPGSHVSHSWEPAIGEKEPLGLQGQAARGAEGGTVERGQLGAVCRLVGRAFTCLVCKLIAAISTNHSTPHHTHPPSPGVAGGAALVGSGVARLAQGALAGTSSGPRAGGTWSALGAVAAIGLTVAAGRAGLAGGTGQGVVGTHGAQHARRFVGAGRGTGGALLALGGTAGDGGGQARAGSALLGTPQVVGSAGQAQLRKAAGTGVAALLAGLAGAAGLGQGG